MIPISRPKNVGSAYARMRYAKIVSMLVICAAAVIVVSAIAHTSVDAEKASVSAPGPPYMLEGQALDTLASPYSRNVTITNLRTSKTNWITSDAPDGTIG